MNKLIKNIIRIVCFCIIFVRIASAQSITGLTGMVSIPTAEVPNDGTITVGASFYNKNYIKLYDEKAYNALGTYIRFSFLPFLELGLRFTRLLDYPEGTQALGDRMPSIRVRVIEEGKYFPSILAGVHDFLRTSESVSSYSTASYIAATKNISILENNFVMKLNVGYGFRIFKSSGYQFENLFYGFSFNIYKTTELMLENDSKNFNAGIRLNLFEKISATVGFMGLKDLSGTVSYSIQL